MTTKIYSLEGVDCSGKQTMAEELRKRLEDSGQSVKVYGFPMYDKESSSLVRMYIQNQCFKGLPAMAIASMYLLDMVITMEDIKRDVANGYNIILDRYTLSNCIHQATTFGKALKMLDLAHNEYKLPKVDVCIVMNPSLDVIKERLVNKENKDPLELDMSYIERGYEQVQQLVGSVSSLRYIGALTRMVEVNESSDKCVILDRIMSM